jgi:polyribonucleotide nucleotidyltransferase
VDRINGIANPTLPKLGDRFLGTVVKTAAFGAFISLLPGRDGLLHISKVGDGKRVEKVEDFLNVGDKVEVEIADVDQRGKIYLDKVRPEGAEAPAPEAGGERPAGRDRGGDRAPRDRGGDRGGRSDRSEGGEGGDGGDRPRRRTRHA